MNGEFSVGRKPFADAVAWVARWISPKPQQPTWAGMRLEVVDGWLTLSGIDPTDGCAARTRIPVDGDAAGTVVVSGRLFAALAGTFPAKEAVRVRVDGSVLAVDAGRVGVTLPVLVGATPLTEVEFPALPELPPVLATVEAAALAAGLARVVPGAGRDDSQPEWTGVHLECSGGRPDGGGQLELLAGQMSRMARAVVPVGGTASGLWPPATALIPAAEFADAARAMNTADHPVLALGLSARALSLATSWRTLLLRPLAGAYKLREVRAALAWAAPVTVAVPMAELAGAVERAVLLRGKDGYPAVLDWQPGELRVEAAGQDRGASAASPIAVDYPGPAHRLAINPAFLRDGLAEVRGEHVEIGFDPTNWKRPIAVTDPDVPDFRYAMAPIKLSMAAPARRPTALARTG